MSNAKKISIIVLLSIGLGGFLAIRHIYFRTPEVPRLMDRLPEGDVLIKANILEVAKETSGMMHYHKIPFRDFFSYEFLLGQAKSYGLNFQRPVYLFANEAGDWGALASVTDSSKIWQGINRLQKLAEVKDTVLFDQKVYYNEKEQLYLAYGRYWIFVYKGDQFKKNLLYVTSARKNTVSKGWQAFLSEPKFKSQNLVVWSNWKNLRRYGIEKAIFAHDSDSLGFTLMAYVKSNKPWTLAPKSGGLGLAVKNSTSRYLNLHVDHTQLRSNPNDPLYRLMDRLSKKVSFPLQDFLEVWKGDISFRQGGSQVVKETFIETVLDDNFNTTEVESTREVMVPGFSIALSVNNQYPILLNRLLAKGIMTQEDEKYRFLTSPQLRFAQSGDYLLFYSGEKVPKLIPDKTNNGVWNEKGTRFQFQIDSVNTYEAMGTLNFPVDRLIRRNKFF